MITCIVLPIFYTGYGKIARSWGADWQLKELRKVVKNGEDEDWEDVELDNRDAVAELKYKKNNFLFTI